MAVEREKAVRLDWDGQSYYFCAKGCRDEFANHPEQFTGEMGDEEESISVL